MPYTATTSTTSSTSTITSTTSTTSTASTTSSSTTTTAPGKANFVSHKNFATIDTLYLHSKFDRSVCSRGCGQPYVYNPEKAHDCSSFVWCLKLYNLQLFIL